MTTGSVGVVESAKRYAQRLVRAAHVSLAGHLPDRLGIYFHELERDRWNAFREGIAYLRAEGYSFVGPAELCEPDGGAKAFVSFDDNYRSWLELLELLAELDLRVAFYVNTAPMRDRATPDEIGRYAERIGLDPGALETLTTGETRALRQAGHVIGAHTHSHFRLSELPETEARAEIRTSKEILEDVLGEPVTHFSYPFGMRRFFNESLRSYCLEIGFETVADATPGLQHAGQRYRAIQRTPWNPSEDLQYNIENLRVDGRFYERLTRRAAAV